MIRVLVTGGLGFIGSRLCRALLREGAQVRCVDDLSGTYAEATAGPVAASALAADGAEVIVAGASPAQVRGMDAVIHLAALPGVRAKHPPGALHAANVELTDRLARAAEAIPYLEKRLNWSNQRGVVKKELKLARKNAGQG